MLNKELLLSGGMGGLFIDTETEVRRKSISLGYSWLWGGGVVQRTKPRITTFK